MLTRLLFFVLLLSSALAGCECEELTVSEPTLPDNTFQVRSIGVDGGFYVFFNQQLDPQFLFQEENIQVEGATIGLVDVISDGAGLEILISNYTNCSNEICTVTLRLIADELNGIRSIDGELLDGDYNGVPGGDFEYTYEF